MLMPKVVKDCATWAIVAFVLTLAVTEVAYCACSVGMDVLAIPRFVIPVIVVKIPVETSVALMTPVALLAGELTVIAHVFPEQRHDDGQIDIEAAVLLGFGWVTRDAHAELLTTSALKVHVMVNGV